MNGAENYDKCIAALASFFVGDATFQETLQRVSDLAVLAVPAADVVGLTTLVDGRPATAVFTDEIALAIDAAQYESDVGPCLDAFRSAQAVRIDDTAEEDRWSAFCKAAAKHGLRSVLAMPLVVAGEGMGALNFYSRTPGGFGDNENKPARLFAAQAAIVLANSRAYWDAHELGEQLTKAMASRATIEQAKGILMCAQGCGPDEAFEMLVRASQRENRKLREIADELVQKTIGRQARRAPAAT